MPQLEEVVDRYVAGFDAGNRLLFPSPSGDMGTKIRSALDCLQQRAKIEKHPALSFKGR